MRTQTLHEFLAATERFAVPDETGRYLTPPVDVAVLARLVEHYGTRTMLEVGTNLGLTSRALGTRFPDLQIVTVDPGDRVPPSSRLPVQDREYLPSTVVGRAVRGMPNVSVVTEAFEEIDWREQRFDLAFIDGDHRTESVLRDTRLAARLLSPGGVLVWHDAGNLTEVDRALTSIAGEFGIVRVAGTWVAYGRVG